MRVGELRCPLILADRGFTTVVAEISHIRPAIPARARDTTLSAPVTWTACLRHRGTGPGSRAQPRSGQVPLDTSLIRVSGTAYAGER